MTTEVQAELARKLNPNRFSAMSGKMAAIVGYLIGERFTNPELGELIIDSSGFVHGRSRGAINTDLIGEVSDLDRNLRSLIKAAELTKPEAAALRRLRRDRVKDWRKEVRA